MKKILLLISISFLVGKNCDAQNLVPNPSFEDTFIFHLDTFNFYNPISWTSFRETPLYFTSYCTTTSPLWMWRGVPGNWYGGQNAASGIAYAGITTFDDGTLNYRDFIGCMLNTPLVQGIKYYVRMKINLADGSHWTTNHIGFSFSTNEYTDIYPAPIVNHAMINSSTVIDDEVHWKNLSGSFIADSAYQYLYIGNFFSDDSTIIWPNPDMGGSSSWAFYYIDDVCVSTDSLECVAYPDEVYSINEKSKINFYPNPATNQLTVESVGSQQYAVNRIEITNSLGVTVYAESGNLKSKIINLKSFPSGIYFIKLYFGDGTMEVKKFVKE